MNNSSTVIKSHRYAKKSDTPLYADRVANEPMSLLGLGNWVGVLEDLDGWYHVLCIQGEGWVKMEDVEARSPFNLHVHWEPGKPIEYVSAA